MTVYLVKLILCSAVFYIAYRLLLERAKIYTFNRIYLLGSLLLSFLIPLMSFNIPYTSGIPTHQSFLMPELVGNNKWIAQYPSKELLHTRWSFIVISYVVITGILFFRFLRNLYAILSDALIQPMVRYQSARIVLMNEDKTPYSFLNYLFIYKNDYPHVEDEILVHEFTHIKQKHSYDILFLELVQVFCWFNPFVFLYRKSVALNHEFLADDAVVQQFGNISSYQYLLIDKMDKNSAYRITSQFNYSITRKRIFMMSTERSFKATLARQLAIVPILVLAVFLFSAETIAQDSTKLPAVNPGKVPSSQEGVTPALLKEYEEIVNKARNEKGDPVFSKFSETDKKRLETIYLAMSKEQQARQVVLFTPSGGHLPRIVPTQEQMEAWKNGKIYGLWIDDKRVSNEKLATYKNTDFAQVYVSKLGKNTVNYGKHYYQVDLMTIAYYEAYVKDVLESPTKYYLAIRVASKQFKAGSK